MDKLLLQNSSQLMKRMVKANTPSAKPITFDDWTSFATSVMELCVDRTSQPLIGNTTSTTSRVPCVQLCSVHKTATTSMMDKSIVIITIQPNLHSGAMDAKQQF